MALLDAGDYRCRQCGEIFPMLLEQEMDVAVGGVTGPMFALHGPGCTHQVFDSVASLYRDVIEKRER